MFIAIVQIPMAKRPRNAAVAVAAKRMEAAFGAGPTVAYDDNHVVVDNETGKFHVDGRNS